MLNKELNVIDLINQYKTVSVSGVVDGVHTLSKFKVKMMEVFDSFLDDIKIKEYVESVNFKVKEFNEYSENLLKVENITIEESEKAVKDIFTKMYELEEFKRVFQTYFDNMRIVVSTLKVLENSFTSKLADLDDAAFVDNSNTKVTSEAGRKRLIEPVFSDVKSYISILEETEQKRLLSTLFRCDKLIELLGKQEQAIRYLFRYIQLENKVLSREDY